MQSRRAFILRRTTLRPVPGLESIRLHLSDEVLPLWHDVQVDTGDPDAPLPYWAFAWSGGLALARYLGEHPEAIEGRRVVDLGTGSGLVAIAAARAGATEVVAIDVDPYAVAAARLNARANAVRVDVVGRDVLDDPPPDTDVIVAGDCWYEGILGERVTRWLREAAGRADVLIGDPGRRYLPVRDLTQLATYEVRTTTELEDLALKRGSVFRLRR